jgi:hypothetical protein
MTIEQRADRAMHEVARRVQAPLVDVDAVRDAARARHRRRVVLLVAPVVVVVATLAALLAVRTPKADPPEPARPPGILVYNVPVWYDAAGLHRGDVVEETAVDIAEGARDGVVTLVRRGALYNDPMTDDVWFHPWGDEPRIVGRGSYEGPSGDPGSDVAAWFEGLDLVVHDTATGRTVARVHEDYAACEFAEREGVEGNGFRHVSPVEVVWRSCGAAGPFRVWRYDVTTGVTTELQTVSPHDQISDVHDDVVVYWRTSRRTAPLVVSSELGHHTLDGLDPGRLSPDGRYLLSGAHVIDVGSGREWRPWDESSADVAWGYGRIAMVA